VGNAARAGGVDAGVTSWLITAIGFLAATCSVISFVPQVLKIWRERDATNVSYRMYVITVTGFSLWLLYGILLGQWPIMIANALCLSLSATILALKLRYDRGARSGAAARYSR